MSIRIAMVGAGEAAKAHAGNLSKIQDVLVAAVSDIDPDRAGALAEQCGGQAYTHCVEMIEKVEPDAVYVCLPPGCHGSLEIELVDMGIPFFVEQPVHLDLDVAVQVRDMVADADLITAVGYQFRYSSAVQNAREFLSNRQASLVQGFYVSGLRQMDWWRQKRLSGGQLLAEASHLFDLLRYLVGEVETVCAFASSGAMVDIPDYDIDDSTVASLEFSDGCVGQMATSCVLKDGGAPRVGLRFDGRGWTVIMDPDAVRISEGNENREQSFVGNPMRWMFRADRAFIEAVKTGDSYGILSDYSDAVRTLDLVLAVDRAITEREAQSPSLMLIRADHCNSD
jgi:predicted dehydrogenase